MVLQSLKNGVHPIIQKGCSRTSHKCNRTAFIHWFGKLPQEFCTKICRNNLFVIPVIEERYEMEMGKT